MPGTFPVSIVSPLQSRTSSAIWNAIPSSLPYSPLPPPEHARGLEQLSRLERAALEIVLDRRVGVVTLSALHRLTASERERCVCEHRDGARIARRSEHGERPREEVVACRLRRLLTVLAPRRCMTATDRRSVDQVVVDERRHVDELDCDSGRERCRVVR